MDPSLGRSGVVTIRRAFSVSIFARNEGAILLVRHRRLGAWLPVGGEIETNETPLEAAQRELLEETGLGGDFPVQAGAIDGTPPGLVAYEEHMAGSKGLHLNFCFVADVPTREIVASSEFDAHRWVTAEDQLECPLNVQQILRRLLPPRG
jgi:8-oxo-dGTP pyrophosphatase MutT (NUDIX family)